MAILLEWWLVPTTADHCGHISGAPIPFIANQYDVDTFQGVQCSVPYCV